MLFTYYDTEYHALNSFKAPVESRNVEFNTTYNTCNLIIAIINSLPRHVEYVGEVGSFLRRK
jgi:hypothetical protein